MEHAEDPELPFALGVLPAEALEVDAFTLFLAVEEFPKKGLGSRGAAAVFLLQGHANISGRRGISRVTFPLAE
jgi:hypothetical protein